jgi:hypothetical protein
VTDARLFDETPRPRYRAVGALPGLAAVMLVASPVAAIAPDAHVTAVCTGKGTRLMLAPSAPPSPIRKDEERPGLCAHATCPREIRSERRRARTRTG